MARKTNHTDSPVLPTVCPVHGESGWQALQNELMKYSVNITDAAFSKSYHHSYSGTFPACSPGGASEVGIGLAW